MNKDAMEQGILFLLAVIVVSLFAFLAWGAVSADTDKKPLPPDSKPAELTRLVPYSDNFEIEFRKAIGEMTEIMKQNGCKEGMVMAWEINPWLVMVIVTCERWWEETKDGDRRDGTKP